ncbi:MAG: adenosine kinase [bacterium]|nr:adenosine kinase [bacterium]
MTQFDFFSPAQKQRPLDITGVENAILDFLIQGKDSDLQDLGLDKGIMKLVDTEEQAAILEHVDGLEPEIEAGGSCANVLRVASRFGSRGCYSSAVGLDLNGALFQKELEKVDVETKLAHVKGETGTSVILVTPDGERTMNTHLGVCRKYLPEHVPLDDIRRSKIFFTTGYMWDTPNQIEAIELALEAAREAGCKVAMDLADPFAVNRSREILHRHLEEGLDVLFSNAEEARILTGLASEEACREMALTVDVAVVTAGVEGAFVGHQDTLIHVEAHNVSVVDTTGAGDCFAAGFLAGLIREQPLRTCAELATLLAADTVGHLGVKLSHDIQPRVNKLLASS